MALSGSLQALLLGKQVAGSKINSKLLDELMAEGLLLVTTRGSRKSYHARDIEALKRFLIDKDENYRLLEVNASDSRSSLAIETGNSKLLTIRSCIGFPVNSYEPVECFLNGKLFVINPPEGCFIFINNWQHFCIPEDVIVVGIENMENFRMIRHQKRLFRSVIGDAPLLFVSRYPQSTDLRNWLKTIPNKYVHFGDFDLAGIHIFLTEFREYLGNRSSFMIPSDIELRLSKGALSRYDKQYDKYHTLRCDIPCLQSLIDLINKYRRGYDQEGYIE